MSYSQGTIAQKSTRTPQSQLVATSLLKADSLEVEITHIYQKRPSFN